MAEESPNETDDATVVLVQRARLGIWVVGLGLLTVLAAAIGVSMSGWPQVATLLLAAMSVVGCIVVFVVYVRVTFLYQTRSARPNGKRSLEFDTDEISSEADKIFRGLDAARVLLFYDLVAQPAGPTVRISESVEPMTRSILVRTTFTIAVPTDIGSGELVLPVKRQAKGKLETGLKFLGPDGERVSSLSQRETNIYLVAVIRFLVWTVGKKALNDYRKYLEADVVKAITSPAESPAAKLVIGEEFSRKLWNLKDPDEFKYTLHLVEHLIAMSAEDQFICIAPDYIGIADGKHSVLGRRLRITSEQRSLPSIQLTPPRGPHTRFRQKTDDARRLFGVRPTVVYFALANADRTQSYHAEVKGPDGTYLARQEIRNTDNTLVKDGEQGLAMTARRGQRHSHLYIRDGEDFEKRVLVTHFYERMPGSMGPATYSALAAAIVIWFCAGVSLGIGHSRGETDLVAILLAFPVVISLWAGLDRPPSLLGDVMIARVTKLLSITLAVLAAALYVLGPLPGFPEGTQWVFLAGGATLNVSACVGSWTLRARVHDHFLRVTDEGGAA